ncbi:MAG: FHA domain-containing protein [Candidatus Thiodiazotropha sp.]
MQLTLKSLTHPQLEDIVVKDRLFAIGRHEPPFDNFENEAVARLSRRHARIFQQDGDFYLVDLDSLNGTTLNGAPLDKQSKQLQQGDEIGLAGKLGFRVELAGSDTGSKTNARSFILTLLPERMQTTIEPIVIAEFPFLLSKSDDLFARYRNRIPDQYKFLSRRHAHIFVRDDNLMIEDLGSTNGTFVSDTRLDEHARILRDGDSVAFGGNDFVYRVHIKVIDRENGRALDKSDLVTEALNTASDITRTTFITSANSFIDIFCAQDDEEEDAGADGAEKANAGKGQEDAGAGGERRRNRAAVFFSEMRRAFRSDEKPARRTGLWVTLGAFALAAGLIGFSYLQGAAKRSIEQQIEAGDYAQAAFEANNYLLQHPDDREVAEMSLKAVSLRIVPTWSRQLAKGDFDSARQSIEQARDLSTHNPEMKPFFELLEWLTAEEAFVRGRGGADASIVLFQDEETIEHLTAWWDEDSNEHQRFASRIVQYVPEFEAVNAQALSHLRTLRSAKSLYLTAIDDLKQQLKQRLADNRIDGIESLLADFSAKYPRISGTDKLVTDLGNYRKVHAAIRKFAWIDAIGLLNEIRFLTPPFQQRVESIRRNQLPPMDIARQYQAAAELWQQGQGEQAIDALKRLTRGDWGEMAGKILAHRSQVWSRYQALTGDSQATDYPLQLLSFYESLDPTDDSYFMTALKSEYLAHRKREVEDAQQALKQSAGIWQDYLANGRITGLQRLEATISRQYREQAKRLSDALAASNRGMGIYHILRMQPAQAQQTTHQAILQETRLQRRSMQELKMVLESRLFEGKIALLPKAD